MNHSNNALSAHNKHPFSMVKNAKLALQTLIIANKQKNVLNVKMAKSIVHKIRHAIVLKIIIGLTQSVWNVFILCILTLY